jgi:hypothetical protein
MDKELLLDPAVERPVSQRVITLRDSTEAMSDELFDDAKVPKSLIIAWATI